MAFDRMRYVHLHAKNYNNYGITFNTVNNANSELGKMHNQYKKNIVNMKIKKVDEKKDAIEQRLNRMLSGQPETKNEKKIYKEAQNFITSKGGSVNSHGKVTVNSARSKDQAFLDLKKHMDDLSNYSEAESGRKGIKYDNIVNYLNEARMILEKSEFRKKDLKESELKKVEKGLDKIEDYLRKVGVILEELTEDNKLQSAGKDLNGKAILQLFGKGSGHNKRFVDYLKAARQLLDINTTTLSNTQGAYLEMILSDYGQICSTDYVINELGEWVRKAKGSTTGTKKYLNDVSGKALSLVAGLYTESAYSKTGNSFVNLDLPYVSFHQTSKTDALLTIKGAKGDPAKINAKNLDLFAAQTYGISLVDETNLMTILSQDFNNNILYHFLNIFAEHGSYGDGEIDAKIRKMGVDALTLAIIYRALTGVSGEMSDFFVVNNNTYNEKEGKQFYVYSIPEIISRFLNLYSDSKINMKEKIYSIYVNGIQDNELNTLLLKNEFEEIIDSDNNYWIIAYQRRFAKLFADMHSQKLKVSITPKVLDNYYNQSGHHLR